MAIRHSFNAPGIILCVAMLFMMAPARSANAQSSLATVTLYSDPSGGSCTLTDNQEGPLNVYVINEISPGYGLVDTRFRVASSAGFTGDYMNEVIHTAFHIGDLRAGIEVAYAYCAMGQLLVATMTYQGHGTSSPCSFLEVLPPPDSFFGSIEIMDCAFDTLRGGTLGPLLVNPDASCAPWCVVATEQTTWGRLKAMYR